MKQKKSSKAAIWWVLQNAGKAKIALMIMVVLEIALSVTGVYNALLYKGLVNSGFMPLR